MNSGVVELISQSASGRPANSHSYDPSVSHDGRVVAFVSDASDISGTRDANGRSDVFVRDLERGTNVCISVRTNEFVKRSTRYSSCEMREIHPRRFDPWEKHPSAAKILLDPAGKLWSSAQFTDWIATAERNGRDQVFVLGGADGLPSDWRPRADVLLSLSPMTFPHELARAVLAEQIYRAFTTLRGHPYPRL